MGHDPDSLDHTTPGAPRGAEGPADAGADDPADIGYEAAYPWLQAPLWREAMLGLPDAGGRR